MPEPMGRCATQALPGFHMIGYVCSHVCERLFLRSMRMTVVWNTLHARKCNLDFKDCVFFFGSHELIHYLTDSIGYQQHPVGSRSCAVAIKKRRASSGSICHKWACMHRFYDPCLFARTNGEMCNSGSVRFPHMIGYVCSHVCERLFLRSMRKIAFSSLDHMSWCTSSLIAWALHPFHGSKML